MTQMSLLTRADAASNGEAVRTLFRERPNTWISALEFLRVGGACSWRSRISECRTEHGMRIQNKQQRVNGVSHSYYRYVANQ